MFNIVFSPTNTELTGQSVIASCATIGVLRVSSALTNTVTVAPWLSMSVDTTNEIAVAVANIVNPFSIGGGDGIYAYETSSGTFRAWERKADGGWSTNVTVTVKGISECPSAEEATFAPGRAFWLVRNAPGPYIYLVGRYTGEDYVTELEGGTAEAPGHTLVANPTFHDIDLNELAFVDAEGDTATPAAKDRIMVMNIAGLQTIHFRNAANTEWGHNVTTNYRGRTKQVWTKGGTIPSGTGFWYMRTSDTPLNIKFESVK